MGQDFSSSQVCIFVCEVHYQFGEDGFKLIRGHMIEARFILKWFVVRGYPSGEGTSDIFSIVRVTEKQRILITVELLHVRKDDTLVLDPGVEQKPNLWVEHNTSWVHNLYL